MRKAVVSLIIKDGLILCISRGLDSKAFGLVGGKVDPGETLEQALVREVKEEAGLTVKSMKQIYHRVEPATVKRGYDFNVYCFYVPDWEGELVASDEGDLDWLTVEEITNSKSAFKKYNLDTINAFKQAYPDIELK